MAGRRGLAVGTPAPVTWLRISHRVDPANAVAGFDYVRVYRP